MVFIPTQEASQAAWGLMGQLSITGNQRHICVAVMCRGDNVSVAVFLVEHKWGAVTGVRTVVKCQLLQIYCVIYDGLFGGVLKRSVNECYC